MEVMVIMVLRCQDNLAPLCVCVCVCVCVSIDEAYFARYTLFSLSTPYKVHTHTHIRT